MVRGIQWNHNSTLLTRIRHHPVGPLMCAGVTMYSALKQWAGLASDEKWSKKNVGIVGIGGLGQIGIKLAVAMGHTVRENK